MSDILLMNKDLPVARYTESYLFGKPSYTMSARYTDYLPYGFQSMDTWLERRPAAKHRRHIADIMKQCGCDNIRGYIDIMHAVSLTDTFWVKNADSDLSWKNVSLYQNEFDEAIARTAFDGNGLYGIAFSTSRLSPELATDGTYDKCWSRTEDGDIYLMKSGSEGFSNAGMEPYSEKLSSDLLDFAGYTHVRYDVCRFHGKLASKCRLFTDENIGYVPFSAYLIEKGLEDTLRNVITCVDETGIARDFYHMLAMDAVLVNTDRHIGNFGFLVDNHTGELLDMAPLFDHNLALRPSMMEGDDWRSDVAGCKTAFGTDFISTAKEAICRYPDLRSEFIRLKDFHFENPGYGFPEWRVRLLNEIKDFQISRILQ